MAPWKFLIFTIQFSGGKARSGKQHFVCGRIYFWHTCKMICTSYGTSKTVNFWILVLSKKIFIIEEFSRDGACGMYRPQIFYIRICRKYDWLKKPYSLESWPYKKFNIGRSEACQNVLEKNWQGKFRRTWKTLFRTAAMNQVKLVSVITF